MAKIAATFSSSIVALLFVLPHVFCTPFTQNVEEKDRNYWFRAAKKSIEDSIQLQVNQNIARNVILFLGDGMSIPTLVASRIYKGQKENRPGEEEFLEFERYPHVALIKTYNVDRQVPDSAATATAFLSGTKANYQTIGVDASAIKNDCSTVEKSKVTSIADWAHEAGKAAGVVTTTAITHATPAALYAHVVNRDWESDLIMTEQDAPCKDIARQLVEDAPGNKLKVIFGGGRQHFYPKSNDSSKPFGERLDENDLINKWNQDKQMEKVSHKFVTNKRELDEINIHETDYVLGLFANRHLDYELERNKTSDGQPSLAEMTTKAIKMLEKSEKGYFLLVEGGRIDHAHHSSFATHALEETLAMEKAIQAAMENVDLKETLIVVTADHAHVMTINGYPVRGNKILGLADISDIDQLPYTTIMYANGPGFINYTETNGERPNISQVDTESPNYRQLSAVPLIEETHGGDDVAVYARGPMAHLFHGLQEQNYVAYVMAYAACIGPYQNDCGRGGRTSAAVAINQNVILLLSSTLLLMLLKRAKLDV